MSRYLPEDIITDILSRLPAKSIQRFRCVCKSWIKLFSNPDFIKIHLEYAKERNTTNLLIRGDDNCMYISRDIDSSSSSSSITCSKANEIDIIFLSSRTCLGSCNGLVCLDVGDAVICFWNPTTDENKRVSKPESCYSSKINGDPGGFLCGLGYDSNNDDYKFVMISNPRGDDGVCWSTEVNLYSLRSNSWKIIECNSCYYLAIPQCVGVFLNGVLHWGRTRMNSTETGFAICHSILSFDVRNEAFNLDLRKPEYLDRYYFPKFGICVLGDRLCMFFEMILGSEHCLDVWVMKEYGVRESWSKLCAVVTNKLHEVVDESPVIPIHILKNGEFLLEKDGDQKTLVLYDPVHSSARVLEINGVPNWLGTETCLESIVSPKLGNHTGAEEHLQE